MSGICSRHRVYSPDCGLCNTDIHELIPEIDELRAQAEKAGKTTCGGCGFVYYLTVTSCPACGTERKH